MNGIDNKGLLRAIILPDFDTIKTTPIAPLSLSEKIFTSLHLPSLFSLLKKKGIDICTSIKIHAVHTKSPTTSASNVLTIDSCTLKPENDATSLHSKKEYVTAFWKSSVKIVFSSSLDCGTEYFPAASFNTQK
ncbi:MAG: hypothetical protein Q7J08_08845 [Methanocorpusculum sp.]|uniref:hypothetical protein n=1 Tax=Methanocorpusculum sp. TaxID=2058474 RepID=UPI00271DE8B1|nr:hypothetical protein [Methanocorpusculum sp.]MDO9523798.1 hypothetical protein [Methanocorpusculum sp.]